MRKLLSIFIFGIMGMIPQVVMADEKLEVFTQIGHDKGVDVVAITPDGHYIVSGSVDSTIKLWSMNTGRMIRTMRGHITGVTSIAISPNQKYIASVGMDLMDASIQFILWDMLTGNVLWSNKIEDGTAHPTIKFSPDGKFFVLNSGSELLLYSIETRKLMKKIRAKNLNAFSSFAFTPNGQFILVGDIDGHLRQWSLESFVLVRTFNNITKYIDPIEFIEVSPDGNSFAIANTMEKYFILWDFKRNKLLRQVKGHTTNIEALSFSPNGKYIASGSGALFKDEEMGKSVKLWDVATGHEVISFKGKSRGVKSIAFSPDGQFLLSGGYNSLSIFDDCGLKLSSVSSGQKVRCFSGHSVLPTSIVSDSTGQYAFVGTDKDSIMLWDLYSGRLMYSSQAGSLKIKGLNSVTHIDVNSSNTYMVYNNLDSSSKLLNKKTGQSIFTGSGFSIKMSPDGKLLLSGGGNKGDVKVWDLKNKKLVQSFNINKEIYNADFNWDNNEVVFITKNHVETWGLKKGEKIREFKLNNVNNSPVKISPHGRYVYYEGLDSLEMWRTSTGQLSLSLYGEKFDISRLDISRDDAYVAYSVGSTIKLYEFATETEVRTFVGHESRIKFIHFGVDGKYILAGSDSGTIKLWRLGSSDPIQTFIGQSVGVFSDASAVLTADKSRMLSFSSDKSVRVWSVKTGEEILEMYSFHDGGWVSILSNGYFNASSPKAAEYLNVRKGLDVYGINQFYDVFYRPDIVKAALAGKDTSSMVTLTIDEAIKNPPPVIEQAEVPASSAVDKIRIDYRIKSEGGGIGEVRVFHNGKLVKSDGFIRKLPDDLLGKKTSEMTSDILLRSMRSISIKAKSGDTFKGITSSEAKPDLYESFVEIEPIPGENEIAIIAFNAQNSVQSLTKTVTFTSNKAPVSPRLYILAVGIDEYKDDSSNLKYAVKDSKDMAAKLLSKAASIYGADNIFVEKLSNAQASRAGILHAINGIAARIKPTDHFILFVASHGVLLGEQYYMVTYDYDGSLAPSQLISSNEIVDLSRQIKALSQLYILDTCHAGGMDGVVSGLYDARMSVLAKKMGLHVFASSSSVEEALDGYQGNGLFTHTLLDGLNNNAHADKNSDGLISLQELGSYSKGQTERIAKNLGHSQEPLIINFGQDNSVYKLQ